MDAVFCHDDDWAAACEAHGFPRLLLTTRHVLGLEDGDEVLAWSDIDAQVAARLEALPSLFSDATERRLAGTVLAEMTRLRAETPPPEQAAAPLRGIGRLEVESFRNIGSLVLDLDDRDEMVSANVVQGPNATGKSSLVEALQLALCGSSRRFLTFAGDKRDSGRDRGARYVAAYLTPRGETDARPAVSLDGTEKRDLAAPLAGEEGRRALAALDGTLLPQDDAPSLLRRDGAGLAADIVGGSSGLAADIRSWIDGQFAAADGRRRQLLGEYGLSLQITKSATLRQKLAPDCLPDLGPGDVAVKDWCSRLAQDGYPALRPLRALLQEWTAVEQERVALAERIAGLNEREVSERLVVQWLERREELVLRTQAFLTTTYLETDSWKPELADQLETWARWSQRKAEPRRTGEDARERAALKERLSGREQKLTAVEAEGKQLGRHLDHLAAARTFLASGWSEQAPHQCPTCGATHEKRTLGEIVDSRERSLKEQRDELRQRWARAARKQKELRQRLTTDEAPTCPLSDEQRRAASESLAWLLPPSMDLPTFLSDSARSTELIGVVRSLRAPPDAPPPTSPDNITNTAHDAIEALDRAQQHAEGVMALPRSWGAVRKQVQLDLAQVMEQHLPRTLEALWSELAGNLHPARWQWQLPDAPRMQVGTRGQRTEAAIRLGPDKKAPLAAYILNSAEVHTLGLAWFLTRHLTRGRFRYAFLVLDDPVRSMDGPAFRDLCRLLATLLRLHRRLDRPLVLLLLMHDDQRALAAAQATGARVHVLGWSGGQARLERSLRVVGDGMVSPQPTEALAAAGVGAVSKPPPTTDS